MTRKHAASLGSNMRSLISDYDNQQKLGPGVSTPESVPQANRLPLSGQLNLLHLNVVGGYPARK